MLTQLKTQILGMIALLGDVSTAGCALADGLRMANFGTITSNSAE
jgi:hypothetical protein